MPCVAVTLIGPSAVMPVVSVKVQHGWDDHADFVDRHDVDVVKGHLASRINGQRIDIVGTSAQQHVTGGDDAQRIGKDPAVVRFGDVAVRVDTDIAAGVDFAAVL